MLLCGLVFLLCSTGQSRAYVVTCKWEHDEQISSSSQKSGGSASSGRGTKKWTDCKGSSACRAHPCYWQDAHNYLLLRKIMPMIYPPLISCCLSWEMGLSVCLSVAPTTSLIAEDFSPSGISSSSSSNHQSQKLLLKPSSQTAATVVGKPQFTTTHLAAVGAAAVKKYKLQYCAQDTWDLGSKPKHCNCAHFP